MGQKTDSLSSEALILAIEESLGEFWGNWGRASQSELYDGQDFIRCYTGVPFAFCNGVICRQFSPTDVGAAVDETISYFQRRNAVWEWIIGPKVTPVALEKTLEEHGLTLQDESFGMSIDLHTMNQDILPVENLIISLVNDAEALQLWANTMIEGFSCPALAPTFVDLESSLGYRQRSYRRYLAFLDHQAIATSAVFLGKHVAGIYCVATVPAARGLGIGTAITLRVLKEAQASGYHYAVLQSSQMGRKVYRSLGFQELSILRGYSPA